MEISISINCHLFCRCVVILLGCSVGILFVCRKRIPGKHSLQDKCPCCVTQPPASPTKYRRNLSCGLSCLWGDRLAASLADLVRPAVSSRAKSGHISANIPSKPRPIFPRRPWRPPAGYPPVNGPQNLLALRGATSGVSLDWIQYTNILYSVHCTL